MLNAGHTHCANVMRVGVVFQRFRPVQPPPIRR